jgi:hypothetical protein
VGAARHPSGSLLLVVNAAATTTRPELRTRRHRKDQEPQAERAPVDRAAGSEPRQRCPRSIEKCARSGHPTTTADRTARGHAAGHEAELGVLCLISTYFSAPSGT